MTPSPSEAMPENDRRDAFESTMARLGVEIAESIEPQYEVWLAALAYGDARERRAVEAMSARVLPEGAIWAKDFLQPDSFGVEETDFFNCLVCGADGSPGKLVHKEKCRLVWAEAQAEIDRLESDRKGREEQDVGRAPYWMIERPGPMWWRAWFGADPDAYPDKLPTAWASDSSKGIRFARREDAEAVARAESFYGAFSITLTEHIDV